MRMCSIATALLILILPVDLVVQGMVIPIKVLFLSDLMLKIHLIQP